MKNNNISFIHFLKGSHFRVDLLLHFTLLVIIYTLMFNFVISKLIKKELFSVLDNYTNSDSYNNSDILSSQEKIQIKLLADKYKNKSNKNDLTYQHNKRLRVILYSIVTLIIIIFGIVVHSYIVKKKISSIQFKNILLENLLLFLLVGIVEIIFTFNIATRYTSINPKFLINYLYSSYNRYVE